MTASQLIAALQNLDPNQEVNIGVRTQTQDHDAAYVPVRILGSMIFACLPEGFVISQRKPKKQPLDILDCGDVNGYRYHVVRGEEVLAETRTLEAAQRWIFNLDKK